MMLPRRVFLLSGKVDPWMLGKKKLLWGLPRGRHRWGECRALLQERAFGSAVEFVACAGPLALFRALIDGDVFYDDTPVWTYGNGGRPSRARHSL